MASSSYLNMHNSDKPPLKRIVTHTDENSIQADFHIRLLVHLSHYRVSTEADWSLCLRGLEQWCVNEVVTDQMFSSDQRKGLHVWVFQSVFLLCSSVSIWISSPISPSLSLTVPANLGARPLLLFSGGCVHSAKPELWDHQKAGVPKPTGSGSLHVPLCKGQALWNSLPVNPQNSSFQ